MGVDYFLKIDGIQGESTDAKHKGEISILSWSWGETQAAAPGTGEGAGKVSMQDFRFSKAVGKASPNLFLACANAERIKDAVLSCRKAGASQDFLTFTLSDVTVSSYEIVGNSGALSIQQISWRCISPRSNSTSWNRSRTEAWARVQKPDGMLRTTKRRNLLERMAAG